VTRDDVTPAVIAAKLDYCPDTGVFRWRGGPRKGAQAGTVKDGYIVINIEGVPVKAHRAAWAVTHGKWPEGVVDHINRDRADNRIANLRDVSGLENARNRTQRRRIGWARK
jgi:hypothetical protein